MKKLYQFLTLLLLLAMFAPRLTAQVVRPQTNIQAARPIPGVNSGIRATGSYEIRYGISKTNPFAQVTRPVILVEGWDPLNGTGHNDIYNSLEAGLRTDLFLNDYDVITLNFDDTGMGIQFNAMLLVELIEIVNNNLKAGNQRAVVIGQSMGGLVARYGLRVMENLFLDHETRLYVSYDTPHQGATVPEGLYSAVQHLVNLQFTILGNPIAYLRNNSVQLNDLYNLLTSSSVSQMLKNNPLQSSFQNELSNFGYPENLRKVAVSNGSMRGRRQRNAAMGFLSPGDPLITFNGNNVFMGLNNIVFANFQVNASQPGSRIADMDVDFVPLFSAQIIDFEDYATSQDPAYEINAGGFIAVADFIGPGGLPGVQINGNGFTFVPFASALDISSSYNWKLDIDLAQANGGFGIFSNWDVLCHSPFDNIIAAPNDNEEHLAMTNRTADWLFDEIQGAPTGTLCRNFCPGKLELTDIDEPICSGVSRTIEVIDLVPGNTVNWTAGPGLSITGGTTGNSIQVTPSPFSTQTSAVVTATITTPCDILPTVVSTTVPINRPSHLSDITYNGQGSIPTEICTPNLTINLSFQAGTSAGADYYEWDSSLPLANTTSFGSAYTSALVTLSNPNGEFHYIRVRAVNACGASTWETKNFTLRYDPYNCSGGGSGPGPIGKGGIQTMRPTDLSYLEKNSGMITLYDPTGKLVYTGNKRYGKLNTLDRTTVPDGRYFLHILNKEGVVRKQIQLKRED